MLASGCNEASTAAAVHDALCGSTAITTCSLPNRILTNTNLSCSLRLESEEGTPTLRNAGLSSANPRGTAVTGLASQ
jgi:hypothetical protein